MKRTLSICRILRPLNNCKIIESMSHTCFGCRQSAIVFGACLTQRISREAYATPLTSGERERERERGGDTISLLSTYLSSFKKCVN